MNSLRMLLKLANRTLEMLRREMADQLAKRTAIEDRIAGHHQTVAAEQRLAIRDYESARLYGGYAQAALQALKAMEGQRDAIAAEIERLRGLIAEAHVEARKFERLIELEETRQKTAREKREDAELDEMATLRAGRASKRQA
jgi:flagellar protein FliJ